MSDSVIKRPISLPFMNPNAPPFDLCNRELQQHQPERSDYVQSQPTYHHQQQFPNHPVYHQDSYMQQPAPYMMGPPQPMVMPGMMPPHMMSVPPPPPQSMLTNSTMNMATTMAGDCESGSQNGMLGDQLFQRMLHHPNASAMFELQIGLEQLIYESHEYETWANAVRDRMTSNDINDNDMALAVDIMIEMAVSVDNCQYLFSRLCQFLDNHIRSFAMSVLIPQLNEFAFNHNEYEYLSNEHRRNFILFLAELYEKIEVNGIRLTQISSLVLDQVTYILKNDPYDASVKAVIKIMKLIGRYLESDQGASPVNAIFSLLDDICNNSKELNESVKGQVLALHQLRENKWGISPMIPATEQSSSHANNGPSGHSAMLIIGPDGKPLSEEECAFLEESCDTFATSNSPNGEILDNDEVLEDYEKFLQATAIRAAEKALEKLSFEEDTDIESVVSTTSGGDAARTSTASAARTGPSTPQQEQYQPKNGPSGTPAMTIVRKEKRT